MAARKKGTKPKKPGPATVITDEVVSYAVRMLARRAHKHEVFALLAHRYGVSTRTCERILARAREELALQAGKNRKEHREDAFAFYVSVMRDPDTSANEKMYAQDRICRLLGLDAPQEHRHGGSEEAGPVRMEIVETVVTTREQAKALLERGGLPVIGK